MNLEQTILKNLIYNENFTRKVLPFIKLEYFSDSKEKTLFNFIESFIEKYKTLPTYEALAIDIGNAIGLSETDAKGSLNILNEIHENRDEKVDDNWLTTETENWCKNRAIYLAIMESVNILDPSNKSVKDKGEIPKILSDALAVSFDNNIGHNYIEDYEERYEFYHKVENKIPTDLTLLNQILGGGFCAKALYLFMSSNTGGGKSTFKTSLASHMLSQGYNVLYITLEMSEQRIAERIDANLFNTKLEDIVKLSKDEYIKKIKSITNKSHGQLIVKEYPPVAASAIHFRALLNELRLKKNFVPNIIFVDYLSLMASSRLKMSGSTSYSYVKSVAEELRGLAVEFNVPIVTSQQSNRAGASNSDLDVTNVSESIGVAYSVDFMAGLIKTDELDALGQILIKQIKNRFGSLDNPRKFCLGIDFSKMRVYDLERSAQDNLIQDIKDSNPINKFGSESKPDKSKFSGFKI